MRLNPTAEGFMRILGALVVSALVALTSGAEAASRSGVTNMTFSAHHGTQIEYLAADGRSFLWYPGNRVVVPGAWRSGPYRTALAAQPGICFRYGGDTYNPATGASGGQWECEPLAVYRAGLVDTTSGDPFALGRNAAVPFDLPRERTSLRALRAQLR